MDEERRQRNIDRLSGMDEQMYHAYHRGRTMIVYNDEPTITDPKQIEGFISVQLLAEIFALDAEYIAVSVAEVRTADPAEIAFN